MEHREKTKEQLITAIEGLQKKLAFYEQAQRIAYAGNWEYDIEHDVVSWSDEMFRIYDIDRKEHISHNDLMERVHPDDRDYHKKHDAALLENRSSAPFEYRIIRRNGEVRYIYAPVEVQRNEAGVPVKMFGIVVDVTQLRQTENNLLLVKQRLELAKQSANLGIWDWDVTNNIMTWDDQMLKLYGITWETFPGGVEAWENGLHPEDRDKSIEASNAALKGEQEYDTDFRVLHPDGTVRHIKANGMVIRDDKGTPVRMLGINYDITERKQREKQQQYRNHTMLTTLIDNVPDLAWIKDKEGRFIIVNEAYSLTVNVPVNELIGKTDYDVWPRESVEKYLADDQAVMAAGVRRRIEEPFVDAEGQIHIEDGR
ncbi:MAG: PAS domain-containing protein [Nitrospirae bacterium]|nr:PAS domain-containing protein [Nitrospirota bacterium]